MGSYLEMAVWGSDFRERRIYEFWNRSYLYWKFYYGYISDNGINWSR